MAVFDGPEARNRSMAAVEAGLSVVRANADNGRAESRPRVELGAAVAAGPALAGSTRVRGRWVWGAEGEPVDTASTLAGAADPGTLLVSGGVAAVVSDRFAVHPCGNDAYRVSRPIDVAVAEARERRIATILVTDVVASTRAIERVGDRAGGELLAKCERLTLAQLVVHGGEVINTMGDGVLAAFDSPARAIRCAFAVRALGVVMRGGVHTGELEMVDGAPRGIAVHVAVRIAARAAPDEVLVGTTTRELAEGAGLDFVDRGEHRLKGLSEPRQLFAAREHPTDHRDAPLAMARAAPFPAGLTAREIDVLRLVAAGRSDAQVAEVLYLSVRTVNAHLRAIYRKVGVRSRAEASRFAAEHGLI
jgi:class 3 adenylate cyclase